MVEHDSWKREEDLENAKEVVAKFEGRINAEVGRQEKLDIMEERDFRRGELLEKYMTKMLYGQDNGNFENKYLRKSEKNQEK